MIVRQYEQLRKLIISGDQKFGTSYLPKGEEVIKETKKKTTDVQTFIPIVTMNQQNYHWDVISKLYINVAKC